jgi:hypothetical protein
MPCAVSTKIEPDSRGLVPAIHHLRKNFPKRMDPRVKPAGDAHKSMTSSSIGTCVER